MKIVEFLVGVIMHNYLLLGLGGFTGLLRGCRLTGIRHLGRRALRLCDLVGHIVVAVCTWEVGSSPPPMC